MLKTFTDKAWEDYLYWQQQDKKTLKRINMIIKAIDRDGYNYAFKVEPLKYNFTGYWSVRIDDVNRLVFKIDDDVLQIIQCKTHYQR